MDNPVACIQRCLLVWVKNAWGSTGYTVRNVPHIWAHIVVCGSRKKCDSWYFV